jgi:hypothetical protein
LTEPDQPTAESTGHWETSSPVRGHTYHLGIESGR